MYKQHAEVTVLSTQKLDYQYSDKASQIGMVVTAHQEPVELKEALPKTRRCKNKIRGDGNRMTL